MSRAQPSAAQVIRTAFDRLRPRGAALSFRRDVLASERRDVLVVPGSHGGGIGMLFVQVDRGTWIIDSVGLRFYASADALPAQVQALPLHALSLASLHRSRSTYRAHYPATRTDHARRGQALVQKGTPPLVRETLGFLADCVA